MKEFAYIHQSGQLPEVLSEVPFLQAFSGTHLDDILYSSCFVECLEGEAVMKEGQQGSRIFILLKGILEVQKAGRTVATIEKSGEVFGEMAVLGSETRSATIIAKTHSLCLAIDQKFLNEIESTEADAQYYAAFYGFLCRVLAQRLRNVTDQLAQAEKKTENRKS